ncbi:MAG: hypothetical protein U9Q30_06510, partial [Campylobacterota bacterium]|nr:hypothetical protein [Campylobacterota bacterium]
NIVYELLESGRDAELMLFLFDMVVEEIKDKKFATRTMVDKFKDLKISKSSVAFFRQKKDKFLKAFKTHISNYAKKQSGQKMEAKRKKPTPTKPIPKEPIKNNQNKTGQEMGKVRTSTNSTNISKDNNNNIVLTIEERIKQNILTPKLLSILTENFNYIKKDIVHIMNDRQSFDVFAIEFYDYIYPYKKTNDIKKIWYVNSFKEKIGEKDFRTIENIRNFFEYKEFQMAQMEIKRRNLN